MAFAFFLEQVYFNLKSYGFGMEASVISLVQIPFPMQGILIPGKARTNS